MNAKPVATLAVLLLFAPQTAPVFGQTQRFDPDSIVIGSAAELWRQRTRQSKEAYLEGLCEGFTASRDLEYLYQLSCGPGSPQPAQARFCGVNAMDAPLVISYVDQFYKDPNKSDIPSWAMIAAYNDKECGETHVLPRLLRLQAKLRCFRIHANMRSATQAARDTQLAECQRLAKE